SLSIRNAEIRQRADTSQSGPRGGALSQQEALEKVCRVDLALALESKFREAPVYRVADETFAPAATRQQVRRCSEEEFDQVRIQIRMKHPRADPAAEIVHLLVIHHDEQMVESDAHLRFVEPQLARR